MVRRREPEVEVDGELRIRRNGSTIYLSLGGLVGKLTAGDAREVGTMLLIHAGAVGGTAAVLEELALAARTIRRGSV